MRDRIGAVGGEIEIKSRPGLSTTVHGSIAEITDAGIAQSL